MKGKIWIMGEMSNLEIKREISNLEVKPSILHVDKQDRIDTMWSSSKGSQTKWFIPAKNIFVKADHLGYEAGAECLASELAHYTNINVYMPITDYYLCIIYENGEKYNGCYCHSFLSAGESFVTLQKLLEDSADYKHWQKVFTNSNIREKIRMTIDFVEKKTKIINFGKWLNCLLEFDYLILNGDRHFRNIGFIMDSEEKYRLMPLFNNGLSFCSDIWSDYPLQRDLLLNLKSVKSRPFSTNFFSQAWRCRELYSSPLEVYLKAEDVDKSVFDELEFYDERIKNRLYLILKHRLIVW